MPYRLIHSGGKYAVQTIASGHTHGFTTKAKAEAQKRLLEYLLHKTHK
jgi:hypothetical protein